MSQETAAAKPYTAANILIAAGAIFWLVGASSGSLVAILGVVAVLAGGAMHYRRRAAHKSKPLHLAIAVVVAIALIFFALAIADREQSGSQQDSQTVAPGYQAPPQE